MRKQSIGRELTAEQIGQIRDTFKRLGRPQQQADRLIDEIPWCLESAREIERLSSHLATVIANRQPVGVSRDLKRLELALASAAGALQQRSEEVWSSVAGLKSEDVRAGLEALNRLSLQIKTRALMIQLMRLRTRRGPRRMFGVKTLLFFLALRFIALDLPLVSTPDGLFVSVALVLHPGRPLSISHSRIAEAIRDAKEEKDHDRVTLSLVPWNRKARDSGPTTLAELFATRGR